MLWNKNNNKQTTMVDCLNCMAFDKKQKKCNGFGMICFEYDPKTQTIYDNKTRLPLQKGE